MMWTVKRTDEFERRHKRYAKKWARELCAVLDNLSAFIESLNSGTLPRQAKFGFIHPEPSGVLAIDQKGGGKNLAATRLYVFPDETTTTLYVVTLGDKQSQADDLESCKRFVSDLNRGLFLDSTDTESTASDPRDEGEENESDRDGLP